MSGFAESSVAALGIGYAKGPLVDSCSIFLVRLAQGPLARSAAAPPSAGKAPAVAGVLRGTDWTGNSQAADCSVCIVRPV